MKSFKGKIGQVMLAEILLSVGLGAAVFTKSFGFWFFFGFIILLAGAAFSYSWYNRYKGAEIWKEFTGKLAVALTGIGLMGLGLGAALAGSMYGILILVVGCFIAYMWWTRYGKPTTKKPLGPAPLDKMDRR
jgi:hypothetical protein